MIFNSKITGIKEQIFLASLPTLKSVLSVKL